MTALSVRMMADQVLVCLLLLYSVHISLVYVPWFVAVWLSGNALLTVDEVTIRWARLVLGWVTGQGFSSQCGKPISLYNQPPRSTQPGHPSMGCLNVYQPKGSDALRLGSKGRYSSCVAGKTVRSLANR